MIKKLNPCPFCGGKAVFVQNIYRDPDMKNSINCFYVRCNACEAHSYFYTNRQSAIRSWNRREFSVREIRKSVYTHRRPAIYFRKAGRLTACPFCGNRAYIVPERRYGDSERLCVTCSYCEASARYVNTMEDAVSAWNRRNNSKKLRHDRPYESSRLSNVIYGEAVNDD